MDLKSFECFSNNSEIDFCPKLSFLQIDPVLEEKLNDIDEFIRSKLGFAPETAAGAGGPLTASNVNGVSCFLPAGKPSNESALWNTPGQFKLSIGFERFVWLEHAIMLRHRHFFPCFLLRLKAVIVVH